MSGTIRNVTIDQYREREQQPAEAAQREPAHGWWMKRRPALPALTPGVREASAMLEEVMSCFPCYFVIRMVLSSGWPFMVCMAKPDRMVTCEGRLASGITWASPIMIFWASW